MNVSDYPILVSFKDITDFGTTEHALEMEPYQDKSDPISVTKFRVKKDNFAELFGEGVILKDISIETTDEAITWGIKKTLPPFSNELRIYDRSAYIKGDKR